MLVWQQPEEGHVRPGVARSPHTTQVCVLQDCRRTGVRTSMRRSRPWDLGTRRSLMGVRLFLLRHDCRRLLPLANPRSPASPSNNDQSSCCHMLPQDQCSLQGVPRASRCGRPKGRQTHAVFPNVLLVYRSRTATRADRPLTTTGLPRLVGLGRFHQRPLQIFHFSRLSHDHHQFNRIILELDSPLTVEPLFCFPFPLKGNLHFSFSFTSRFMIFQ